MPSDVSCPNCGSLRIAELFWGMPADIAALKQSIDAGEIILAGCSYTATSPAYHCRACHHEFGLSDMARLAVSQKLKSEADKKKMEEDADKRGILIATLRNDGWTRCPYCNWAFSTLNSNSWDGTRHKSCLTRLDLIKDTEPGAAHQRLSARDV